MAPTVRRYGTRQVAPVALPGVRKTAAETSLSTAAGLEAARAETAEAIGSVGASFANRGIALFGQIQEEARRQGDEVALLEAENKLTTFVQQRLYDPERGALAVKGKDAMPLPEQVNGEFEKVAGEIAKGLSTVEQRTAFARLRANRALTLDLTMRRHVFEQMQQYEAGELSKGIDNGINEAIANAQDPRRVSDELVRITEKLERHGPRAGLGPEAVKAAVDGARTQVHVGVIDRLLANGQDRTAQVYFEETRGQIKGDALKRIEKALEEGSIRGESQRQADVIVAAGGTLTEQRDKAKAIADPKVRDAVLQRIEHEATVREREDREREERTMVDAYNTIDRTRSIDSIPPSVWAAFNGATRSAMRNYAEQLAKGTGVKTDYLTYYSLLQQAAGVEGYGTPQDFMRQNLLNYRHKLDETEFKQLAALQNSLRQGEREAAEKQLDSFRTNQQIVTDTLTQAGIDTSDSKDNKDRERVARFRQMLDQRVDALQRLTNKNATNADVQQLADDLLKNVTLRQESSWLGFVTTPITKRLMDVTPDDVPAKDRQKIEAALRKRGRPVTPEAILNWYLAAKRRAGE